MKKYTVIFTISIAISFLLILGYSCEDEEENNKPTCSIISPLADTEILQGETVSITVEADDKDGDLKEVRFYIDDIGVSSTSTFPYTYEWNTSEVAISNHTIKAEAIDYKNAKNENTITVSIINNQLGADFVADKTSINLGDTINFSDQSAGISSSWEWNFGDGNTSTEQNPVHTYSSAGIYTVKLTITNDFSSDIETKPDYIVVQTVPSIITTDASSFTATTAILGGNVTSDGHTEVTERGIYYGTSSNPESTGTKIQIGSGSGSFYKTITGLTINTTYFVRAYAINSVGENYGNEIVINVFSI